MWARVRLQRGVQGDRLAVSVVASERVNGRVQQSHVASLGSVPVAATVWDRHLFWCAVMQKLNALGRNRITEADKGFVVHNISRKIPPPREADWLDLTAAWLEDKAREEALLVAKGELKPLTRPECVFMSNNVAATLRSELVPWIAGRRLSGLRGRRPRR